VEVELVVKLRVMVEPAVMFPPEVMKRAGKALTGRVGFDEGQLVMNGAGVCSMSD
jgi:hypothetical protein